MLKEDIEPILKDIEIMQRDLDSLKRASQAISPYPDDSMRLKDAESRGVLGVALDIFSHHILSLANISDIAGNLASILQKVSMDLRDKYIDSSRGINETE